MIVLNDFQTIESLRMEKPTSSENIGDFSEMFSGRIIANRACTLEDRQAPFCKMDKICVHHSFNMIYTLFASPCPLQTMNNKAKNLR